MEELDIQASSTTLGYEGEGGKIGAAIALAEGIVSKDAYTALVVKNAEKFKEITEKEIPEAVFSVSVLASAINPEKMKELIGSVDYPYSVKWGYDFLTQKQTKVSKEGYSGLGAQIALTQELAYAMLQASTDAKQIRDTISVARLTDLNPVKIRTCIETVSLENELEKIKYVNGRLKDEGKNTVWVIEPNKKVGDGSLSSFLNTYDRIVKSNPNLSFGIDLDMGGLTKESNLLQLLDRLDSNHMLPVYISLSGQEYTDGEVRTHLPLGRDLESNGALGRWLYTMQLRGKKIPGLVIETSPTQQNVLRDYHELLKSLKKGFI